MENPIIKEIIDLKDHLVKKSIWIIGGDGWAYDRLRWTRSCDSFR